MARSFNSDKEREAADQRFAVLSELVKRLGSQETIDKNWPHLVLDVRQHVEFIAREIDQNEQGLEVYHSGAGKSGGQRQKLAATCLAAALRYQLGGQGVGCLYWGDIDTYGLAILNHARAALANVESMLMDVPTLLAHQSLWGCESRPYPEADLASLTAPELALLNDLRSNRWGQGVRLEQERIPWSYAVGALLRACNDAEPPTVP